MWALTSGVMAVLGPITTPVVYGLPDIRALVAVIGVALVGASLYGSASYLRQARALEASAGRPLARATMGDVARNGAAAVLSLAVVGGSALAVVSATGFLVPMAAAGALAGSLATLYYSYSTLHSVVAARDLR
jgi:hypothetical protein